MNRMLVVVLSLVAGCLGWSAPASSQEFPKGPVKIIVPFPPGGPTDTVGRLLAQKLQETWGQHVVQIGRAHV